MIIFPPAKINIGLQVTGKRSDGYHSIESVFYPIPLTDVLELLPNEKSGLAFETFGLTIPADGQENLCQKAYRLLDQRHGLPGMKASLLKNIPTGAGLGGGSSDASAMINLIDAIANLQLNYNQKKEIAAELGSDCPYFIQPQAAFVRGRGEIINAHPLSLNGKYLVLVHPNIHVPTADAYRRIKPKAASFDLQKLEKLDIREWKDVVFNDFEAGIFDLHPVLNEIKESMYQLGATYASMSGSGSSIYGIFDIPPVNLECFNDYFCWSGTLQ